MSQEILIITTLFVLGFGVIIFLLRKWLADLSEKQRPSEELVEWLKTTSERLDQQNKTFLGTLQANTKALNERLDKAAQVIAGVQKILGK